MPSAMPLFGSIVTHLILAVTLVLAAAVAGLMAFHYARARILERRGYVFEPEAEEPVQPGTAEQRAKSAEEIAQIRSRIEALMEQQQVRSETQSQHLAQKLDEIRTHMNTQDRKFDGIKSELRHEIHRRNGELDELRHQLATALDAFWKSMPALPEGASLALPSPASPPLNAAELAGKELAFEEPASAGVLDEEPRAYEEASYEEASYEAPPPFDAAPVQAEAAPFEETPVEAERPAPLEPAERRPDPATPALESTPPADDLSLFAPFDDAPMEDEPAEPVASIDVDPAEEELAEAEAPVEATVGFEAPAPVSNGEASEPPAPPERVAYEEAVFEEDAFEEDAFEEDAFEEDAFEEDASVPAPTADVEPASPAEPASAPPPAPAPLRTAWITTGGDGSAPNAAPPPPRFAYPESAPPPAPEPTPEPPAAPVEGDDLTVISGITPALQDALYAIGVTTLEVMARWSRADARRIGGLVGVSEEVIMHQWIFEAQSALFEQYQALMTQQA